MKSNYYTTCLRCGANLDPGEKCDCVIEAERYAKRLTAKKADKKIYIGKAVRA